MKTDLQITNQFEKIIAEHLNDYLDQIQCGEKLEKISNKNIEQAFPDVDNSKCPTMFWIVPSFGENEELSVGSDFTTLQITLFITSKRSAPCNLQKRVFGYLAALELLIWNYSDLEGDADFTDITSYDFYPAIEGNKNIAGMEVTVRVQYAKEFTD